MTPGLRRALIAAPAGAALTVPAPAAAHAFAVRYDLPLPLWLYLAGAGAAVALSFVVMALVFRRTPWRGGYGRLNLLRFRVCRLLAHRHTLFAVRVAFVAVYLLVIVAGYVGNQNQLRNIAPVMVWVIWWVGLMFVCALVGNLWALINPLDTIARWSGAILDRILPGVRAASGYRYPEWLGVWPSVVFFMVFAWAELVWQGSGGPANLSVMIFTYSAMTWVGMVLFRREVWLRNGEAFTVAFGLAARFAPIELRVSDPKVCAACTAPQCVPAKSGCVDCHDCYGRAGDGAREWNLRPYAVGLLNDRPVHPSMMVFVMVMLATVTFDGFMETPAWVGALGWLGEAAWPRPVLHWVQSRGIGLLTFTRTVSLLAAPLVFLAVYMLVGRVMKIAVGAPAGGGPGLSTVQIGGLFVLYLVPIAIAYHLAHYLSFLLLAGQLAIPLASDPFGYGWDLFGTARYAMDIGIIDARFVWYTSVAAMVTGHMVAVYLAHVAALRAFADPRAALRSQYPMLVLMVCYTMISLWILAQPVVVAG